MNLASLLTSLEKIELSSTSIIVACVALVIVSLLMLREFLTWMVKTNRVRQDIHDLAIQIQNLEERLKMRETHSQVTKNLSSELNSFGPEFNFPLDIKETKSELNIPTTTPTGNL